jgi:molecular chaperone GrpE (heat shock protein)
MSDWGAALNAVLGVAALVAIVASVVAYLRANLAKTTIETLEASNRAFSERVTQLESENGRVLERMAALEAENHTLRSIVTGVDQLKRLAQDMAGYHEGLSRENQQIITVAAGVHDLVVELLKRTPST